MTDKNNTLFKDLSIDIKKEYEKSISIYRYLHQIP